MSACVPAAAESAAADRYFTVEGARLRYRDEGAGAALVLVHGWTLDLEMWEPQVAAWRDAFRLIRLDRRGHGLSGGRPAPARDGADLAALCRHLELTQVAVLGMSQGVRGALAFAAAEPARVRALILDGPPELAHSAPEDDVPLARYQALLRAQGIEALRREWARHPLMQLCTPSAQAQALLGTMLARYRGEDLRAPLSAEPEAAGVRLAALTVPTLVLSGEYDVGGRVRAADRLCAALPRGTRAVIPAAGHLANLDNPQAYNQRCRAFLCSQLRNST
jgi:pimeloyl-ACP methyl ester carboxylesterase